MFASFSALLSLFFGSADFAIIPDVSKEGGSVAFREEGWNAKESSASELMRLKNREREIK